MGVPYVTVPRLAEMQGVIARFRDGYAEAGHDPATARVVMALHTYVADSDAAAEREARACLNRYVVTRLYAKRDMLWDDLRANQLIAVGAADTVTAAVETLRAAGATDVICLADFGGLPQARVLRSMELFATQVAPRFATTVEPAGAGRA